MELRRAAQADAAFIAEMLEEASNWDPGREREPVAEIAHNYPEVARYVAAWGRDADRGFVAEEDGRPIGAAWYRLFTASAPAFGFVDERTPELAIGVVPEYRGRGVGTELLTVLLDLARLEGYAQISLSVELTNPARRLYRRLGFEPFADDEDGYQTMLLQL